MDWVTENVKIAAVQYALRVADDDQFQDNAALDMDLNLPILYVLSYTSKYSAQKPINMIKPCPIFIVNTPDVDAACIFYSPA